MHEPAVDHTKLITGNYLNVEKGSNNENCMLEANQKSQETFEKDYGGTENRNVDSFICEKKWNKPKKVGVISKHDRLPSDITGSCFDKNGYLLIADNANKSVKSLNVSDCLLMSVVLLEGAPWDLTYVKDENAVAVTIPNTGNIHFLSPSQAGDLFKEQKISAGEQCRGIVYSRGCFIVSYGHSHSKTGGKVQILHTNGILLRTISKDGSGNKLFQYASHLALSKDENTIYVTDFANCSITSLQIDGTVNAVFKNDTIKDPRGLTVGSDDSLYVCDLFSNCVHLLSKDMKKCKIVADKHDGVTSPRSVAIKKDYSALFVTMFYKRFIIILNFDG